MIDDNITWDRFIFTNKWCKTLHYKCTFVLESCLGVVKK